MLWWPRCCGFRRAGDIANSNLIADEKLISSIGERSLSCLDRRSRLVRHSERRRVPEPRLRLSARQHSLHAESVDLQAPTATPLGSIVVAIRATL
jgi:hypothetical protein